MQKMKIHSLRYLGLFFLLTLFWINAAGADTLKGRDYVRLGKLETITGTLIPEQHEWMLKAEDKVYELHLGPSAYRESKGVVLEKGLEASVQGFIYNTNVAVTQMTVAGKTTLFRDKTGRAAWAGSRFARGRNSMHTAPSMVPGHELNINKVPELEMPKAN